MKLPKYKLSQRDEPTPASPLADPPVPPEEDTATQHPIKIASARRKSQDAPPMDSTADMLEDAYGAETRARKKRERLTFLKRLIVAIIAISLCFAATLAYAHSYKTWPLVVPTNWYLPFLLSACLSTWFCFKSVRMWFNGNPLTALFGLAIAILLVLWNLHVLQYATRGTQQFPSNALWVPTDADDLWFTSEFNSLHGVPMNRATYTALPERVYRRTFNTMPVDQWRPYFRRFLNNEEMEKVNVRNIQKEMHTVTQRMVQQRQETWVVLEEKLKAPPLKFRLQQLLLKPYTWLISYL